MAKSFSWTLEDVSLLVLSDIRLLILELSLLSLDEFLTLFGFLSFSWVLSDNDLLISSLLDLLGDFTLVFFEMLFSLL